MQSIDRWPVWLSVQVVTGLVVALASVAWGQPQYGVLWWLSVAYGAIVILVTVFYVISTARRRVVAAHRVEMIDAAVADRIFLTAHRIQRRGQHGSSLHSAMILIASGLSVGVISMAVWLCMPKSLGVGATWLRDFAVGVGGLTLAGLCLLAAENMLTQLRARHLLCLLNEEEREAAAVRALTEYPPDDDPT